jgi:hypothetical protein
MNKRIKELMDKATTIEEYGWGASYENFDREKFAELIVRECCDIADEVERADMDSYISKYIKAHFGVDGFKQNILAGANQQDDDDKEYKIGTKEAYDEFVRKRNDSRI